MAAREAGLPVTRFKWGDLELGIAETAPEPSTPQVIARTVVDPTEAASPYERLFKGQLPSFRGNE